MPWSRPTLEQIYQRIVSDIESRLVDKAALLRRAVLRVLAKVFSGSIHLCFGYLEWVSRQLMVDTAETEWLNRHGFIWNITRKSPIFATGSVYFTGVNGTDIPIGTRMQSPLGVEYETLELATVSGTLSNTVAAQCLLSGEDGNTTSNTLQLVTPILNVNTVSAIAGFSGGRDEESDTDYRERILARIQNPPMGGTATDYEAWAKEVNGVDEAWCFPRVAGDGTVGVVIKATGSNPVPSDTLCSTVYEWIFAKMPVGATLVNSTTRRVDAIDDAIIAMKVKVAPYSSSIAQLIQENMQEVFDAQAYPGQNMLISQIRDAISNAGVDNYIIDFIFKDGFPENVDADIPMVGYEYPILDTLYVEAL